MYNNPMGATSVAATGTLAATGGAAAAPVILIVLGGAALVGAAMAVGKASKAA